MTPDEHTIKEFFLDAGDGHQLYVHDWGSPAAKIPIVFLHGGPGNGCDDKDKSKFDPFSQRVIFHDQRGSGKSTPSGSLEHNTTADLIGDIVKIKQELGLGKFVLVGGSWGSTLALAFAIEHPKDVAGLVIDGVFLAGHTETGWLDKGGWRGFFPDLWEEYAASVPFESQDSPTAYHVANALGPDPALAKKSAYEYLKMELALLKLDDIYKPPKYDEFDPAGGKIELYYLSNGCFLPEGHILKNAPKLAMPVRIVQGRYDMICPPEAAYKLHRALPDSQLVWTINSHMRQHEAKNIQKLFIKELAA